MNVKNAKLKELIELTKKYPVWDKEDIKRFVHLEDEIDERLNTKLIELNDKFHTIISVENIQIIRVSDISSSYERLYIRYSDGFELFVNYESSSTMNSDYRRLEAFLLV